MTLIGFGPISQGVNSISGNQESLSNVAYDTSNIAYEAYSTATDTSNLLTPRQEQTVTYLNDVISIANASADEATFSSSLYDAFKGRPMIQ